MSMQASHTLYNIPMASFFSFTGNFFETLLTWVLPSLFKILFILAIAFAMIKLIRTATDNFVRKFQRIKRAETLKQIMGSTTEIIILAIAIMMILNELGIDIRPIIASAGILGVAFGLGAQHLMKDVINGFFILFEDQFGIGDTIKVGDFAGTVEKMNLRTTTLKDSSGSIHIVPNGQIVQVSIVGERK